MIGIIFIVMLVILFYRAGIMGVENPVFTNATYIVGLITTILTIAFSAFNNSWKPMDIVLSFAVLIFMFLLKPIVRKLLDLYDLTHQIKPDERDRIYTKHEVYDDDDNSLDG
ncbi:MAG: hypothetical protein J1F03_11035 [Oscillospiraceae bacterium]|nr:hypothetical protein [Oscillospiraceae bacterium]